MERDPRVVDSGPAEQVSEEFRLAYHWFGYRLPTDGSCPIQPKDFKNE
jgi:hypothetical protein